MIRLLAIILVLLWITAIASAFISETELDHVVADAIAYENYLECWDGFNDYDAGRHCSYDWFMSTNTVPKEDVLSLVGRRLGDRLHESFPKITLDAGTINSIEALTKSVTLDDGDKVDGGFQESVFIGGSTLIDMQGIIDVLTFEDGVVEKNFEFSGNVGTGMNTKPNESAMEAFTEGTSHGARHSSNNRKRNQSRMRLSRFANEEHSPSKFFRGLGGDKDMGVVKSGPEPDHTDKVVDCDVGFNDKVAAVECKGSFQMDFGMDTTTDSLVQSWTGHLDKHLAEYLPKQIRFGEDVRMAVEHLESARLAELDDDEADIDDNVQEWYVEMVGRWTVNFGCKVVVSKPNGGKPTISVQCGGKGVGGIGILPPDDDNEL